MATKVNKKIVITETDRANAIQKLETINNPIHRMILTYCLFYVQRTELGIMKVSNINFDTDNYFDGDTLVFYRFRVPKNLKRHIVSLKPEHIQIFRTAALKSLTDYLVNINSRTDTELQRKKSFGISVKRLSKRYFGKPFNIESYRTSLQNSL